MPVLKRVENIQSVCVCVCASIVYLILLILTNDRFLFVLKVLFVEQQSSQEEAQLVNNKLIL